MTCSESEVHLIIIVFDRLMLQSFYVLGSIHTLMANSFKYMRFYRVVFTVYKCKVAHYKLP